jgi:hypothetical protein
MRKGEPVNSLRKPPIWQAIGVTTAAILYFCLTLLMVALDQRIGVLVLWLFVLSLLMAQAIRAWVWYFKKLISFEVEQKVGAMKEN